MSRRGIETAYSGVRFRSRLEARWARMFDLLGWRWEYEPVDLDGYIPDFVLMFPAGPVLVEVKPEFTVDALIEAAAEKIDQSGWTSGNIDDALIVGATWLPDGSFYLNAGALRQNPCWGHPAPDAESESDEAEWGVACWIFCNSCRRVALHQELHMWRCVACGACGKAGLYEEYDLESVWRDAGNAVRWTGGGR